MDKYADGVRVLTAGGAANPNLVNHGSSGSSDNTGTCKAGRRTGTSKEVTGGRTSSNDEFPTDAPEDDYTMEYESSEVGGNNDNGLGAAAGCGSGSRLATPKKHNDGRRTTTTRSQSDSVTPVKIEDLYQEPPQSSKARDMIWLFICFIGIMASFVLYGLLLEYTTSGGRKLHELSFLFVTSGLYTVTAAAGRYVRGETPSTIPPPRFAILGLTSMGSTFTSVRSLR